MTRLGTDKELRKGGRYARVMGTLWRHPKREKCGRAAMGLLLDIWSYCADQGVRVVTKPGMIKIFGGDPNARRQLKELVDAGFVDVVEGGHSPHDWSEHSEFRVPIAPPSEAPLEAPSEAHAAGDETRAETRPVTRDATRLVTRDEMRSPPENTQESTSPRAHASPKSPCLQVSKEEERENARAISPQPSRLKFAPDPHAEALSRVRQEFGRRYHEAEKQMWTQSNDPGVFTLVAWLNSLPAETREESLTRTLNTFFADPWVHSKHYPVGHLARHVAKYFEPREAPSKSNLPDTPASLRMQAREAVNAKQYDRAKTLVDRADALEAEASRRQSHGR